VVEVELDSVVVAALVLELSSPPPQAETVSGIATARAIRDLWSTEGLLGEMDDLHSPTQRNDGEISASGRGTVESAQPHNRLTRGGEHG
jgi:hypothetical protein